MKGIWMPVWHFGRQSKKVSYTLKQDAKIEINYSELTGEAYQVMKKNSFYEIYDGNIFFEHELKKENS